MPGHWFEGFILCDYEPLFCVLVNLYISLLEGGCLEDGWLVHVTH